MQEYKRRPVDSKKQAKRKKAKIRSIIILVQFVVIIVLSVALIAVSIKYNRLANVSDTPLNTNSYISSVETPSNTDSSSQSSGYTDEQIMMMAEVDKWYLMLVNPDKSIDNDFINNIDRKAIDAKFCDGKDSSKYLDARIVESFNTMCKAALNDGISLVSISSYRTYSYQNNLFKNRVERCIREGYSEEKALEVAATIVAKPGTSEHHLGLAVDINSVSESFENTNAFKWLKNNAADYGFILRYPKNKQNITKIIYEPWHYRYVGVEHAKAINELGMCLEEYIEYLSSGGAIK